MVDWLYMLPKVESDYTHMIFYVIPEEKMINSKGDKIQSEIQEDKFVVIYSRRLKVLKNVVRMDIKRLDFLPLISKFF